MLCVRQENLLVSYTYTHHPPECSSKNLRVWRGLYIDRYHETKAVIMRIREAEEKDQQCMSSGEL